MCLCCATSCASRCAPSAIPWPRIPGGSGPIGKSRRRWRKQTGLGRFVSTYGWRAYALPGARRAHGVGGVSRPSPEPARPDPSEAQGPAQGPPDHRRGQHVDRRRTAQGADPVRRQPADRHPARRRALHRGGRRRPGTSCPATDPKVGQGTAKVFTYTVEVEDGIDTTSFGGDDELRADGQPDPGQPEELDAQPAVRVHPHRQRRARLPGVADHPDDGPRGLRLRDSHRDVLLQPVLRPTASPGCSSTRPAGCAARCRSRAMWAPTAST